MRWLILPVLLLLVAAAGCAPSESAQVERRARQTTDGADVMALAVVTGRGLSYQRGAEIYTDTYVKVLKGRGVAPETVIALRRPGGEITDPATGVTRGSISDFFYSIPEEGGEVFLLLRKADDKFEILDAMPLVEGKPVDDRPSHKVYLEYLNSL